MILQKSRFSAQEALLIKLNQIINKKTDPKLIKSIILYTCYIALSAPYLGVTLVIFTVKSDRTPKM